MHEPPKTIDQQQTFQAENFVEITSCRGLKGGNCRHCLIHTLELDKKLRQALRNSSLCKRLQAYSQSKGKHPARLRIAIAGCPNACSMPQIKAIGMIVRHRPFYIKPGCDLCGACMQSCQEEAFRMNGNQMDFDASLCVGCGQCLEVCPHNLIAAQDRHVEILIAGTMGRHPRFAQSLGEVTPDRLVSVFGRILDFMSEQIQDNQSISAMLHSIDMSALKKHLDL